MGIRFMDLRTQWEGLADDIRTRIDRVLESGMYIMGPEVGELECQLAGYTGTQYALGCSSGTDALLMPLMAYDVGPGDAVFTTPFTFIATAEVIALLGATPVFVDIDPRTFNIDPHKLAAAVATVKKDGKLCPRGVIPVDLFGLAADYDAIDTVAEEHDLFVIEDAAQSIGGARHGVKNGAFGHVAATSFYPAKPLGCYGDGGAVFTNDQDLYNKMASIRVHGQGTNKYENVRVGINGRLDAIQAAVLLAKLTKFDDEIAARQRVADRYTAGLKQVLPPMVPDGYHSAWAIYSVLCEDREAVHQRLKDAEIPAVVYYPIPLHLQRAFKHYGYSKGDFPVSEQTADTIISLPMHPFLTDTEVDQVIAAVNG